jgi:hypothetical protein
MLIFALDTVEFTQELLWAVCDKQFDLIPEKQALKSAMMEILSMVTDAAVRAL